MDVLPHDGDGRRPVRPLDPVHQRLPLGEVRLGIDSQVVGEVSVQALLVQHQRHLVDGVRVDGGDHPGHRHVTEQRDLLLVVRAEGPVRPEHDHVGLESERT